MMPRKCCRRCRSENDPASSQSVDGGGMYDILKGLWYAFFSVQNFCFMHPDAANALSWVSDMD